MGEELVPMDKFEQDVESNFERSKADLTLIVDQLKVLIDRNDLSGFVERLEILNEDETARGRKMRQWLEDIRMLSRVAFSCS